MKKKLSECAILRYIKISITYKIVIFKNICENVTVFFNDEVSMG